MPLTASFGLSASGQLTKALDVESPVSAIQSGSNNFPDLSFALADGSGNLQAQSWWSDTRTVAAGVTDSIDLNGVLTHPLGGTINWTTVRAIVVAINVPDGTKLLRIGPQGVANAAVLGFGGNVAQAYIETDTFVFLPRPYGGWTITAATADLLPVKNPTGVSIDYTIWILGTP